MPYLHGLPHGIWGRQKLAHNSKSQKITNRPTQPQSQKSINLKIKIYNIISMNTNRKINELDKELTILKWDIVGNLLYYKDNEETITLK